MESAPIAAKGGAVTIKHLVHSPLGVRGSSAVETCVAMTFVAIVTAGGLVVTYAAFARLWLARVAYESSICLTDRTERECERESRTTIARALPIGEVAESRFERSALSTRVDLQFKIAGERVVRVQDSRRLPLWSGDRP